MKALNLFKALHNSGYVHNDIRPSNILRAIDGSMRLVDLETVREHHCTGRKKKGGLLRMAVGGQCAELLHVAKYLRV